MIFIEVALTRGVAGSIHDIIRPADRQAGPIRNPNTAIFYSINNSQNGLAGLGLGKVLIFQVVDAIKRDHPEIKTFATLSPIPGLWKRYLSRILEGDDERFAMKQDGVEGLFSEKRQQAVMDHYDELNQEESEEEPEDFAETLTAILSDPTWIEDETYRELLEKPLIDIAYFHVAKEEKRPGKPLNPVANFHMGNGAKVNRRNVNFGANRSERGTMDSCGLMVNYVYSESRRQQISRRMRSLLPWRK